MDKTKVKQYFKDLADNTVRFSPHTIKQMGLIPNQTILKIEHYMLICSPFRLSMKTAVMLLILSKEEIQFFKKYENNECALSLVFHKSDTSGTLTLDVKGKIIAIGPVKGRQNVCMIDINFTRYDPRLIEIIGDYIFSYKSLQEYFDKYRDAVIPINPENIRNLRFNNFIECYFDSLKIPAQLASISASKLSILIAKESGKIETGRKMNVKLYFQLYRFMVQGLIGNVQEQKNHWAIEFDIDFSPELIEILDDYYYRKEHHID